MEHIKHWPVFFDVYICFFAILIREKHILGLAISPVKSIHCIVLYLVSIGWIFNFLGSVLSLKIVFTPRFFAKK